MADHNPTARKMANQTSRGPVLRVLYELIATCMLRYFYTFIFGCSVASSWLGALASFLWNYGSASDFQRLEVAVCVTLSITSVYAMRRTVYSHSNNGLLMVRPDRLADLARKLFWLSFLPSLIGLILDLLSDPTASSLPMYTIAAPMLFNMYVLYHYLAPWNDGMPGAHGPMEYPAELLVAIDTFRYMNVKVSLPRDPPKDWASFMDTEWRPAAQKMMSSLLKTAHGSRAQE